ncbi:MAG: L-aspartate oxidase, partial [Candidatus Izemoplasmatales bacterium]
MERKADVLIIGSGLAGIFTALNIDPKFHCIMIAKERLQDSNSMLAQGGIAAELNDDPILHESHFEDTLKAGSYLNEKAAVSYLVDHANEAIGRMIELGVRFDTDENNHYLLTKEGGHSHRRILHSGGDASGFNTTTSLTDTLRGRKNIQIIENTIAIQLIQNSSGKCIGAYVLEGDDLHYPIFAKSVVLATGGIGSVYGSTTNDLSATGDGIGMAKRMGAKLRGMEFVQFHPTALHSEENKSRRRFLITEALRGEGAYLVNIEEQRFMQKYDPERMELAPRDIVSQAIYREMYDTWTDHVYIDTRHLDPKYLEKRFPTVFNRVKQEGYVMGIDLIPVAPCEHFLCGGIETDLLGRSSIEGLYAVGESASTGVHGANRLASNSLLECVVYGLAAANDMNQRLPEIELETKVCTFSIKMTHFNYKPIRKKIGDYMDEHV